MNQLYPDLMHPGLSEGQVSCWCRKTEQQEAGQSAKHPALSDGPVSRRCGNIAGEVVSGKGLFAGGTGIRGCFNALPRGFRKILSN